VAIGEVIRTPTGSVQTTALSYFSRLSDAQEFTRAAQVETARRGTETAGIVCAVMDGAEWLQPFVITIAPTRYGFSTSPMPRNEPARRRRRCGARARRRRVHGSMSSCMCSNMAIRRCAGRDWRVAGRVGAVASGGSDDA